MNTSTIAWHRTSDRMPDDSILVIAADNDDGYGNGTVESGRKIRTPKETK